MKWPCVIWFSMRASTRLVSVPPGPRAPCGAWPEADLHPREVGDVFDQPGQLLRFAVDDASSTPARARGCARARDSSVSANNWINASGVSGRATPRRRSLISSSATRTSRAAAPVLTRRHADRHGNRQHRHQGRAAAVCWRSPLRECRTWTVSGPQPPDLAMLFVGRGKLQQLTCRRR